MDHYILVNTDNYGGDYPNETVLSTTNANNETRPMLLSGEKALEIQSVLNKGMGRSHPRYWKVEPEGYKPQPGFEL